MPLPTTYDLRPFDLRPMTGAALQPSHRSSTFQGPMAAETDDFVQQISHDYYKLDVTAYYDVEQLFVDLPGLEVGAGHDMMYLTDMHREPKAQPHLHLVVFRVICIFEPPPHVMKALKPKFVKRDQNEKERRGLGIPAVAAACDDNRSRHHGYCKGLSNCMSVLGQ